MMRYVIVHHGEVPTALVRVPSDFDNTAALEYAYRLTQNIEGSWSKGSTMEWGGETRDNPDYSPNRYVLPPLPVRDGVTIGLRSSMMGDEFVLDGIVYVVGAVGFKRKYD